MTELERVVQLHLFEDVDALPWGGRSPRSLTRASIALFLGQARQKHERFFVDPNQVDMFRRRQKRPRGISPGASLLCEPRRAK